MSKLNDFEMVIGLEVHAQINTHSKLFSGTSAAFGAEPNTQVNPIDLGMPGVLPVLNKAAVDAAIKTGLALRARINRHSVFARKNYFYPDLPKGYQISQYEQPIVEHGSLTIDLEDGTTKDIGVTRLHLEEDAGKSVHDYGAENISHVDLNRSGVALMEIVSEPDIRSAEEAMAYVRKLRSIVRFLDVCDGNMEQGSMRCDVNISVRPKGETKFGTRAEIKNVNSIRFVGKAIEYEFQRQVDIVSSGGTVVQETRLWDAGKNITRSMRGKEDAHDYRYFPDPDLLPLKLTEERVEAVKSKMPELPDEMKARFMEQYGLGTYDASVLTLSRASAQFYEEVVASKRDAKLCANWMTVELFGALNRASLELHDSPISPAQLGALVDLIAKGTISGKIAKTVFEEMFQTSKEPQQIVEEKGLIQISDAGALKPIVTKIVADNPDTVAQYKEGNERVFGFFVGQVMKETQGKANPALVNELLRSQLGA